MQVRLGEFDTSRTDDGPTVDVDVERVESHPRFNKPYMTNDIAIVYLKNDVEFTGSERRQEYQNKNCDINFSFVSNISHFQIVYGQFVCLWILHFLNSI